MRGGARVVRNAILRVLASIPAVGEKMASVVEEVEVGYQDIPAVVTAARHTMQASIFRISATRTSRSNWPRGAAWGTPVTPS